MDTSEFASLPRSEVTLKQCRLVMEVAVALSSYHEENFADFACITQAAQMCFPNIHPLSFFRIVKYEPAERSDNDRSVGWRGA